MFSHDNDVVMVELLIWSVDWHHNKKASPIKNRASFNTASTGRAGMGHRPLGATDPRVVASGNKQDLTDNKPTQQRV